MLLALYFAFKPILIGLDQVRENPAIYFENMNLVLIFMGLGVSFSALQDTTKTQNKLSRKIYQDPVKGKILIVAIIIMIGLFLGPGLQWNSSRLAQDLRRGQSRFSSEPSSS